MNSSDRHDAGREGGQVVDPLAHRAAVLLQHPSRNALHVDRLGNGEEIVLGERGVVALENRAVVCELLGG